MRVKLNSMKETRTINLNGVVFNIDNDAFQILNDYLHDIELRLPQIDQEQMMNDIERRICEFLQKELFACNTQVVDIMMIRSAKELIGDPSEFGANKRPRIKASVKSERSGCGRVFGITVLVLLFFAVIPFLLPILLAFGAVIFSLFGVGVPLLFDAEGWQIGLAIISFFAALMTPIIAIICLIATYARTHHVPKTRFWLISIFCWLVSLGCFGVLLVKGVKEVGGWEELKQIINEQEADETGAGLNQELTYFNAINIDGTMNVDIIQGETQNIVINDSMLVAYQVKDSVLAITGTDINGARHATVTVTDLTVLNVSGASKVDVQGQYKELHLTVNGASKLDAEEAETEIVHINCLGASKASVNATKELWAQASGASKITYKGRPAIKRNMSVGASKISHE